MILAVVLIVAWQYVAAEIWPQKPRPPIVERFELPPIDQSIAQASAVVGLALSENFSSGFGAAVAARPPRSLTYEERSAVTRGLHAFSAVGNGTDVGRLTIGLLPSFPPRVVPKIERAELIRLGDEKSFLRATFTTRGGALQQLVLPQFQHSSREGLPVKLEDGSEMPLFLIPGVPLPSELAIRGASPIIPVLAPGVIEEEKNLGQASYLLYHYADPRDNQPLTTLGTRIWKASKDRLEDGTEVLSFQTDLQSHGVRFIKTFTLKPREYHIGFQVRIEPLPDLEVKKLRYQISGPVGMPIEGEWYTSTYRNVMIGFLDRRGRLQREMEDSATIHHRSGSDRYSRGDGILEYAAVALQYFASALAVDEKQQPNQKRNFIEFIRATPQGKETKNHSYRDDITFRAISEELLPNQPIQHQYVLYQGPVKVRLLHQLKDSEGKQAVPQELVDRYEETLHLKTMTDWHSPNALGRFANAIWWTDLVIFMTNLMHGLLGLLNRGIPSLGICILCLTLIVRALLFPLSRKQAKNAMLMQTKMAALAPEVKRLQEKFKDDFQAFNRARMELMLKNGVNPFAQLGGCLLIFAQMPVFTGLYFALQESIYFRLADFLWIRNLAAPDMLFWWTEGLFIISMPEDQGGMLYLGPYFNILPIIAITLMMIQQKVMMPPPTDEQQELQQKMMKMMMIVFGILFYKVAAGLCLYFIASTAWGLIERKLIPKPDDKSKTVSETGAILTTATETPTTTDGIRRYVPGQPLHGTDASTPSAPVKNKKGKKGKGKQEEQPKPGLMGRLKNWIEEVQEQQERAKRNKKK